jgi:hypothetical protein
LVPLARYFIFVGGVLLALLFVVDWFWQTPSLMAGYGSPIGETTLRIRSEHKWPQKVELDTTTPIIAPSPSPAGETAGIATPPGATPPGDKPALSAFAQADPPPRHIAKRKWSARERYKNPNSGDPVAFAVNPYPPRWPVGW